MSRNSYPPAMVLRPLDGWPIQLTKSRRDAPFRAAHSDTLSVLDRELRLLDPKDRDYPPSILQVALSEGDFRRDGMPRADARMAHPGVILSIEPRNRPKMSFPCDTFTHWHDNLRAITLGLESLRKLDRYGITQTGQQYRGWQAIEGTPSAAATLTREAAAKVLRDHSDVPWELILSDPAAAARAVRKARGDAHPDRHDGAQTAWDHVQLAIAALRAHGVSI